VLLAVANKKLTWCVSRSILEEYAAVLYRPKFSKIPAAYIAAFLALASKAETTTPTSRLRVSGHEEDNRFYERAQASQAAYIVTGNAKHFTESLPPTKIVNARQLLEIVDAIPKA
jgi:putative PIN family toxin of toxin-antitoxin system